MRINFVSFAWTFFNLLSRRITLILQSKEDLEGQEFLFVYLGKTQKRILEQFGARILLDATYKTCKYPFNLFNLVVKTPQRYMVS